MGKISETTAQLGDTSFRLDCPPRTTVSRGIDDHGDCDVKQGAKKATEERDFRRRKRRRMTGLRARTRSRQRTCDESKQHSTLVVV